MAMKDINMILITGHLGFIGRRLKKLLSNRSIGYDLINGDDIRDLYKLDTVFKNNNIKTVIHLAARAGVRSSKDFPDEYITTNIIGVRNIIKCSEKYKIEHLIFFSSSSVYGSKKGAKKENDLLFPESLYAITKATGEMLVNISEIPIKTIIRPFTVYGEEGRKDQVIYKWINQIRNNTPITFYGDGNTKRGYTYVGDLIKGVKLIIDKKEGGILNLGGNEVITLSNLLEIFKKNIKQDFQIDKLPLLKEDVFENYADIIKANKVLGWKPETNFKNKVAEIINKELNNYGK